MQNYDVFSLTESTQDIDFLQAVGLDDEDVLIETRVESNQCDETNNNIGKGKLWDFNAGKIQDIYEDNSCRTDLYLDNTSVAVSQYKYEGQEFQTERVLIQSNQKPSVSTREEILQCQKEEKSKTEASFSLVSIPVPRVLELQTDFVDECTSPGATSCTICACQMTKPYYVQSGFSGAKVTLLKHPRSDNCKVDSNCDKIVGEIITNSENNEEFDSLLETKDKVKKTRTKRSSYTNAKNRQRDRVDKHSRKQNKQNSWTRHDALQESFHTLEKCNEISSITDGKHKAEATSDVNLKYDKCEQSVSSRLHSMDANAQSPTFTLLQNGQNTHKYGHLTNDQNEEDITCNNFLSRDSSDKEKATAKVPWNGRINVKRGCRLWEFIRDLLLDNTSNPSLIKWENRSEGTFRIVRSKAIAKMWGRIKGNDDMNFEKLSRAMRYYYKKHIFRPVVGQRLVYRFGVRATGFTDND